MLVLYYFSFYLARTRYKTGSGRMSITHSEPVPDPVFRDCISILKNYEVITTVICFFSSVHSVKVRLSLCTSRIMKNSDSCL